MKATRKIANLWTRVASVTMKPVITKVSMTAMMKIQSLLNNPMSTTMKLGIYSLPAIPKDTSPDYVGESIIKFFSVQIQ